MNGRVYDPVVGRFISADPTPGSGLNRYSYVGNNPLTFTDPTGYCFLGCFWQPKHAVHMVGDALEDVAQGVGHVADEVGSHWRLVAAAVAAYYTGGLASGLFAEGSLSAAVVGGTVAGGTFAGSYTALNGGNLGEVARATLLGGATGAVMGGFAHYGALGRAFGGGVNGYLQTGNSSGFLRGFGAGLLPQDLGFSSAYNSSAYANLGISIAYNGIRGGIVGGRSGIGTGILIGESTSFLGHIVGLISSGGLPTFRNGAFIYDAPALNGYGAITLGNVITGPGYFSNLPPSAWLYQHEMWHVHSQIEQSLGALYVPAHLLDLGFGYTGQSLGFGYNAFIIEEQLQAFPYSSAPWN